uniref:Uncharacterized protein n=1 Tax=Glossina pallidipes TaxID=7398 RepID=A0A1A9ZXS7_GLOPL
MSVLIVVKIVTHIFWQSAPEDQAKNIEILKCSRAAQTFVNKKSISNNGARYKKFVRRRYRIIDALFLYVGGNDVLPSWSLQGACGDAESLLFWFFTLEVPADFTSVAGAASVGSLLSTRFPLSISIEDWSTFMRYRLQNDRLQSATRSLGDRDIENTVELNR